MLEVDATNPDTTRPSGRGLGAEQLALSRPAGAVFVTVEIPRFGFEKRDCAGELDFVSPLPCPFNYGSVDAYIGLEGDLLDAVILGPRLRIGSVLEVPVWGAIGLSDRGLYDDKLICAPEAPSPSQWRAVARFFNFYGRCKRLLNLYRGRPGRTCCEGFVDAREAIARCRLRDDAWHAPRIDF